MSKKLQAVAGAAIVGATMLLSAPVASAVPTTPAAGNCLIWVGFGSAHFCLVPGLDIRVG